MDALTTLNPDAALAALLNLLKQREYRFTTITPASHARVLAREPGRVGKSLTDMLGWSLPFERSGVDPEVEQLLDDAHLLQHDSGRTRALVRVSSLDDALFVHSAYPTDEEDSVFFGPDTYRFARLIRQHLQDHPPRPGAHIVDIGTGAGVGGIVAGLARRDLWITLTDVNRQALRFARINARTAGVTAEFVEGDTLDEVDDPIDLAIANPPYIIDSKGRAYRDGGDLYGGRIALDMACMAADRLAPGGSVLLYTGASVVAGQNPLCDALAELAEARGYSHQCDELDPDVFGEELSNPGYEEVDRIAVIAATLTRPA